MSEETLESGMSSMKKTIIGIVTTAVTAAGAYVTTHIEQIFGSGEEKEKTEQVDAKQESQQNQSAPIVVNIENTNQQKQSSSSESNNRVVEKKEEKPAAPAKKEVEDEDPW